MRRSAVFLSLLALLVWGCGGGSGAGGDADPAKVLPRSAIAYVEAVVRPHGDQRSNAEALLRKVLRTDDPGAEIGRLLDDDEVDFSKDVEPWLGDRAAMAVVAPPRGSSEPGFVAAIATSDPDKAAAFVKKQEDPGDYAAVAGAFVLVANTQAALTRAQRLADDGGDGLADVKRFRSAIGDLPDERLGALWMDPARFGDLAAAGTDNALASSLLRSSFGSLKPVTAVLTAGEDTATVELRGTRSPAGGDASGILESLPSDAWAAFGAADVGKALDEALARFGGAIGPAVIAQQLEQATGLRLREDVLSWVGDAAVFVSGNAPASPAGALVVEATDEDKAAAALPRLVGAARQQLDAPFSPVKLAGTDQAFAAALPGAPAPVVLARAGDRVVLALGEATAKAALEPASTLGDTDLFDRATDALDGYTPALVASVAPMLRLGDTDEARPYLETLDLIAAGTKGDRSRFTVRVK